MATTMTADRYGTITDHGGGIRQPSQRTVPKVSLSGLSSGGNRSKVARMYALAAGPLDAWLYQVALVLDDFFDSIEARA